MGITGFSETFKSKRTVTYANMKNEKVAVDAYTEIFRAALGGKTVNMLTDKNGKPTVHISTLLGVILSMYKNRINPLWIFDNNSINHNTNKIHEWERRRQKRVEAQEKLDEINEEEFLRTYDNAIPDDVPENQLENKLEETQPEAPPSKEKESLEKRVFRPTKDMMDDVKTLLEGFDVKYYEAPAGYEAEHVCADLSSKGLVDAVLSCDSDSIPFGARKLYRRNNRTKTISEYTRDDIIEQIKAAAPKKKTGIIKIEEEQKDPEVTLDDIRRVCVVLGTDIGTVKSRKTPGIGPKTVFKKYKTADLSDDQKEAYRVFNESIDIDFDIPAKAFTNIKSQTLIDWLVDEKSFNKKLLTERFKKHGIPIK